METKEIIELKDKQSIKTTKPTMKIAFQIWWWMFLQKICYVLSIFFLLVLITLFLNIFLSKNVFLIFEEDFQTIIFSLIYLFLMIFLTKKIIGTNFKNFTLVIKNNRTKDISIFATWKIAFQIFWFVFWRTFSIGILLLFVQSTFFIFITKFLSFGFNYSSESSFVIPVAIIFFMLVLTSVSFVYIQIFFIKKVIERKFRDFTLILKRIKK